MNARGGSDRDQDCRKSRGAWLAAGALAAGLAAILVMVPGTEAGSPALLAALVGAGVGLELLTAALLIGRAERTAGGAMVVIGGAYLFAGLVSLAAIGALALLPSTAEAPVPQAYAWLLMWSHVGFAAFALFHLRVEMAGSRGHRALIATVVLLAIGLAAGAAGFAAANLAPTPAGAWLVTFAALALLIGSTRGRRSEQRWLAVALVAALCALSVAVIHGVGATSAFFGLISSAALVPVLIVEERRTNDRLAALAIALDREAGIDPLTGLGNRRLFDRRLEEEWRRAARSGRPLAVLMVDVDRFKRINDSIGHIAGDAVLKRIATLIGEAARRAGDVAARFGGDEFVLLLPETDYEHALHVAELIQQAVRTAELPEATTRLLGPVTVSIGAASAVPDPEPGAGQPGYAALVEQADRALLAAKRNGRDRIVGAA